MAHHPPSPPSAVQVNGIADAGVAIATKATSGMVAVSAVVDDPDAGQKVRLITRLSTDLQFSSYTQRESAFGAQGRRAVTNMYGLKKNTRYYGRCYTQAVDGQWSHGGSPSVVTGNFFSFWTDRYPGPPTIVAPADNVQIDTTVSNVFDWQIIDDDEPGGAAATGWQFQWRHPATATKPASPWGLRTSTGTGATSWTAPPGTFYKGIDYEWRVRTRDTQNQWGYWSVITSFSAIGVTRVPRALTPGGDVAAYVDDVITFAWFFSDPAVGAVQGSADIRYRVVGTSTWFTIAGASTDNTRTYDMAPLTLLPGFRYEWQVQTTRATGTDPVSDWSASATFWSTLTPGSLADLAEVFGEGIAGQLGCGRHRAYIFDRGGLVERGEVTKFTSLTWNRKRDDISNASIVVDNYDPDLADLLGKTRSWIHELVIYRDDERVWEGPFVHREMRGASQVTYTAWDVMAYPYRRILRQGYNDSYKKAAGVQIGIKTVVERAGMILVNALSYADPNVLPYLTLIKTGEDAQESRIVPDYTKTVWQDLDDMAANAGLDYTVAGRRIILWDTHTFIGQTKEMRDGDFTEELIVTEYGMNLANYFGVTDGQGAWGAAWPLGANGSNWLEAYGPVEMLASGYGDTATTTDNAAQTPAALAELREKLTSQARRNIGHRWPTPLVARVPDNSGLKPDVNVTINQLIPGIWVPLRVENTVQPFAQMQKLDSVTVTEAVEGETHTETVAVVMSPAPLGTQDPDAAGTEDGGAGEDTG